MDKPSCFIFLCQRAAFLLEIFAISLDIFHHQVFPRKFVVVGKVIDNSAHNKHMVVSAWIIDTKINTELAEQLHIHKMNLTHIVDR